MAALREEVLPNIPWVLELPISRLVAERVAVAVAVARSESDLPMPDYNYYLNRDRPLADRFAGPKYSKKPLAWKLAKAIKAAKYPPTPPKGLKVKVGSAKVADAA
ncbi:unnamed protein product [Effrenium voratum]|uniref:Uncharacterized protein n=1 Tax=Effrenium voratum TaxID=2562239 RepID=A0AA36ITG7_9DINO|nr:unnamed protein product [Effrenium voratum]